MKVLTISGCKGCSYLSDFEWKKPNGEVDSHFCTKDPDRYFNILINGEIPTEPHPNCPLNDLPTEEQIEQFPHKRISKNPYSDADSFYQDGFNAGANWVIEQITK